LDLVARTQLLLLKNLNNIETRRFMTIEEIIEKATVVLAEEFEIEESDITPDASLKDTLGLDSLDLVDVVVLVEQNFGITLTGPDFIGIATFKDFYELLHRKING